jgi:cytochrome b
MPNDAETIWIPVWDPLVRLFHWSLALSFAIAWFSANAWDDLHIWAGYASGALILARVAWGVFGTPYARFSQFVRSPRSVLAYLKAIARGGEQRYVGHNPAGGAMVVALILNG